MAGMNEFTKLRTLAREKRDKLLARVRAEYDSTLVQIAALERELLNRELTKHKTLAECVAALMPSDRPFTVRDIMIGLEAMDDGRIWRRKSVDYHFSKLRELGVIRRIKRASVHEPAQYVKGDLQAKAVPLDDMTLEQTMHKALTRPMTSTELTVAVIEAGYQTAMKPNTLRSVVMRLLRQGGFKRDGGKWVG